MRYNIPKRKQGNNSPKNSEHIRILKKRKNYQII